jgi:hypothetical protein
MDNTDLNIETKLLTLKNELKSYFEKKKQRVQLLDLRQIFVLHTILSSSSSFGISLTFMKK